MQQKWRKGMAYRAQEELFGRPHHPDLYQGSLPSRDLCSITHRFLVMRLTIVHKAPEYILGVK